MKSPDMFIANYLDNGVFSQLPKCREIEKSICEMFPYISVLYLLEDEVPFSKDDFCDRYSERLRKENECLKSFLNRFSFLYNREIEERSENINRLNAIIVKLNEEISIKNREYTDRINELEARVAKMQKEKVNLLNKIDSLHENLVCSQSKSVDISTCTSSSQEAKQSISLIAERPNIDSQKTNNCIRFFDINGIKLKMKLIRGGDISYSANSSLFGLKSHIEDFYCSEILVSQDLWFSVMNKVSSSSESEDNGFIKNATLKECLQFIDKLNEITGENFRLLTEKEWHYAALHQLNKKEDTSAIDSMPNADLGQKLTHIFPSMVVAEAMVRSGLFANKKPLIEKISKKIFAQGATAFGEIGEYVLDLNATCKRIKSIWDGSSCFLTSFNCSNTDGLKGIRLALSVNPNMNHDFVDLGLSALWAINESITCSNTRRMPTPEEARELLTLHHTTLENGSVIRFCAPNGNYIYMYSSWYRSSEFTNNKRFCYNPRNCTYNTIYDKEHYRRRFVTA